MMTGYMIKFFIKHYDLMSPVIFKEDQEVASTPVKSVWVISLYTVALHYCVVV